MQAAVDLPPAAAPPHPGSRPDGTRPTTALGRRVAAGIRWSLADQVVQQSMRMGISVLLARLLLPRDFGLAALAFIVSDLAKVFGDIGVAPSLVYVRHLRRAHVDTACSFGLVVGAAFAAALTAMSGLLAQFFQRADVQPLLIAMSSTFVIKGLIAPMQSMWRRNLDYRPFAVTNGVAVAVAGAAAIAGAAAGLGVWALVVYALGESVTGLLTAYVITARGRGATPRLGFEMGAFRELAGFGMSVSGTRLVLYGRQNVDNVIVGRVLGPTALGFYDFAYNLMLYPVQRMASIASGVTYPAFTRLRDDRPRLRAAFTKSVRAICVVVFPVSIASSMAAPLYVPLVFGERWQPAVLLVEVLAINGVRLALTTLNGTVMESTGRPQWNLLLNLGQLVTVIPAFAIGVRAGIVGVAVGYTTVGFLALPVSMHLAGRRLGLPIASQLKAVRAPVLGATVMAVAMKAAMHATAGRVGRLSDLVVVLGAGVAAYALLLVMVDREILRDSLSAVVDRNPHRKEPVMPEPSTVGLDPVRPIVRMSDATPEQWRCLGATQRAVPTAERVLELLRLIDNHRDGFALSQLAHCLQTATRAERAGADDDLVVAALCHDVGKVVPHNDHGAVAAALLRPYVRPHVAEIVRTHAAFQRRYTHHYLGGSPEARRRYRRAPWYADAEQFCEWDQASFDPDYDTLPLEHFEERLRRVFDTPRTTAPAGHPARRRLRRLRRVLAETLAIG